MYLAGIILGLLLWRAVPYCFRNRLSQRGFKALRISCRLIGIIIIFISVII